MKMFALLLLVAVYRSEAAIKCVQGTDGTAAGTDCAGESEAASDCSQPKFVEYTGMSAVVEYKCGACAANTEATCESCTGAAEACNTVKETADDFKCKNYAYSATDKKFNAAADSTVCKRLKATKIMCNMPGTKATDAYKVKMAGCGPCTAEDKKNELCAECDTADCTKASSATALAALLLPLIASLYTLL
ncbi:uncharacterized protein LOC134812186 [Bolinopsis microptera]|uniref:uncharacterized protein LOC134812186 n=1 Tax=Bolinopsis microptera TaxID=2820187 RepID=UPI003079355F